MQGGRKLSSWNVFVKKIYSEGKAANKTYQFKDALKDASRRKSEMGSMSASRKSTRTAKATKARSKGRSRSKGRTRSSRRTRSNQ